MSNKKWLVGVVVVVSLVLGALFVSNPNFLKGSLGGVDFGQMVGRQAIRDVNQIMAPSGVADLSSFNILPPYQPEYEKLYPAYNGIRATAYLENIDFSLYANDGKIQGAGGSFSRRRPPSGNLASNWITILKYESHLKQVMGDDVCPYTRGLSYAENHCTWMPVNPAHGELGKSFGRYVIFNFDTADKPSTLRGMVTLRESPYRNDFHGDSAIEIFTVPSGAARWDWQASCDKLASENQKECNFTLPEGYKVGQVVVARSFKYDHSGTGAFGGTPYVWDIQIENVKIPDPKIMVFSRGVGGGSWTSRPGALGDTSRDGEVRVATIIGLNGKTYTQTVGLGKCLEDGTSGTKLEETLRGKNRNEAEYIAGQVQKATGQMFLGKVEDLMKGKKGPGQDIGMCDHSDRCKKAQEILSNAGGGLDAGQKVGGKDASWMMEGGGGEGDATDKADKAAKEQIQATKDLPAAEKVAKEAQEQADKLRQDRDNAANGAKEANAQKTAAENSYKEAVKEGNATKILVEEKRLEYARQEAKKADAEKSRQNSGGAISDRLKAEKEATAAAEKATALKRKATGDDTACSPEDDGCLDKKAVAQLRKSISGVNQFLPAAGQIDFSKGAGLPKKVTSSGVIGLDKQGNPIRNNDPLINPSLDAQGNPKPPVVEPKTRFEKCLFLEQKVIPLGNPGEEGFKDQCFEDCAPADVAVGNSCGQNAGPQSVPVGTCGQNVYTKNQQGAMDCAQNDFECERNKNKKVANCQDGFPPRNLCSQGAVAVFGCPERDSGLCRGIGGRPPNQ